MDRTSIFLGLIRLADKSKLDKAVSKFDEDERYPRPLSERMHFVALFFALFSLVMCVVLMGMM